MISHDPAFCFIDRLLDPARLGVTNTPVGARLHPSQINVNAGQYQSPYTLAFDFDWATLTHGLEKPPFVHWREQGREPAFARGPHDWFAPSAYARARHVHAPTVGRLTIQRVADARCSYRQLRQQLRPGDVLYLAEGYARQDIRRRLDADDPPPASHALLWLGEVGQAPAGAPLVSDSYAANWLRDTYGSFIPSGVQLRPFYDAAPGSDLRRCCPPGAQSAYFEQFLWASRLLPDVVESEPVGIVEEWLEVATFAG